MKNQDQVNEQVIKIYVSCHKETSFPKNKLVFPIQVGAATSKKRFAGMLHDDEGQNISLKNPMYCELTAQYWAWKNDSADYYGFMHYRRYFSFNSVRLEQDIYGNVIMENIDEESMNKLKIEEKSMRGLIQQYDIITTEPLSLKDINEKSVYEHYKNSPFHLIKDLDLTVDIIAEKYPEFMPAVRKYLNSDYGYFCNMYIMKNEIFHDYSKWLFDILEEHEKRGDYSNYNIDEFRISGFLAERLFGIYYTHLKLQNRYKVLDLQRSLFNNTTPQTNMVPAFLTNNIPIVLSADDKYVPYVATLLQSIIDHSSQDYCYDIVILHQSISDENQNKLKLECAKYSNFSIRFFNVRGHFKNHKLFTHRHFTVEIYFRLLLQVIMEKYKKVVYLDSDLIVNDNIANLYNIDVTNYLVGAVQDVDSAGCYNGFDLGRPNYFEKNLKLKDPFSYFNSGVLIFNLDEFRKLYTPEYILDLAASKKWQMPDQDVLNILCENKVKYIDESWNVMMNWNEGHECRLKVARLAPKTIYQKYLEARKSPKIVHFAGHQKPWLFIDCDFSQYFWKYSMRTGFYETILSRALTKTNTHNSTVGNHNTNTAALTKGEGSSIRISGIEDSIYVDGLFIKLINKINQKYPKGSKKRERLKRVARFFVK